MVMVVMMIQRVIMMIRQVSILGPNLVAMAQYSKTPSNRILIKMRRNTRLLDL